MQSMLPVSDLAVADVLLFPEAANDVTHRYAVCGVGAEPFAEALGGHWSIPVRHGDLAVARYEWSRQSDELATWLDDAGPWVLSGAALVRALRKWIVAHPDGRPCTTAVFVEGGAGPMAKQATTIWNGFAPALEARGVAVLRVPASAREVITRALRAPVHTREETTR